MLHRVGFGFPPYIQHTVTAYRASATKGVLRFRQKTLCNSLAVIKIGAILVYCYLHAIQHSNKHPINVIHTIVWSMHAAHCLIYCLLTHCKNMCPLVFVDAFIDWKYSLCSNYGHPHKDYRFRVSLTLRQRLRSKNNGWYNRVHGSRSGKLWGCFPSNRYVECWCYMLCSVSNPSAYTINSLLCVVLPAAV